VHQLQSVMTDEEGHATVDMTFHKEMIPADYFFQVRREERNTEGEREGGRKAGIHIYPRFYSRFFSPLSFFPLLLPLEQATAEDGQIGYSQSVELRHQGQQRRLYGTHMYV